MQWGPQQVYQQVPLFNPTIYDPQLQLNGASRQAGLLDSEGERAKDRGRLQPRWRSSAWLRRHRGVVFRTLLLCACGWGGKCNSLPGSQPAANRFLPRFKRSMRVLLLVPKCVVVKLIPSCVPCST